MMFAPSTYTRSRSSPRIREASAQKLPAGWRPGSPLPASVKSKPALLQEPMSFGAAKHPTVQKRMASAKARKIANAWTCEECGWDKNFDHRTTCEDCGARAPRHLGIKPKARRR